MKILFMAARASNAVYKIVSTGVLIYSLIRYGREPVRTSRPPHDGGHRERY